MINSRRMRSHLARVLALLLLAQTALPAFVQAAMQQGSDGEFVLLCTKYGLQKVEVTRESAGDKSPAQEGRECPACFNSKLWPPVLPPRALFGCPVVTQPVADNRTAEPWVQMATYAAISIRAPPRVSSPNT